LVFATGSGGEPKGARLAFDAPSRWAVDALHRELATWTPAVPLPASPTPAEGRYGLSFSDPSGLILNYGFHED
jgi:hypothetical protein